MRLRNVVSRQKLGLTIALFLAVAALAIASGLAQDKGVVGPDIVTFRVYEPMLWGSSGGISAYSLGTESCNRGDEPANWYSGTPEHPVIAQNLYRLADGRLEQIGMSWLKHGFTSLNDNECDTCVYPPAGGSQLGVGCSDPYWASLNGSQDRLGPRHEVNAFTGVFSYPHSTPTGDNTLRGRLLASTSDVDPASNPGAKYFAEGQYVTADEATAGNGENSASYREQEISASLDMTDVGSTFESAPAIYAWEVNDPAVTTSEVRVPGEGLFIAAAKASDNGNGTWRYEYAILNLNSDRSGQSFTVPIAPGAAVTNTGFHDVDYHSGEPYDGTDWAVTVDTGGGTVTWATDPYSTNPDANALRWGTMYNFWFDANVEPDQGAAEIVLFRPGTPTSVEFTVPAPADNSVIFTNGFESGDTTAWSLSVG